MSTDLNPIPHSFTNWEFNGIKMRYTISRFKEYSSHIGGNKADAVRLHFGLKGDYNFTYKQLDRTYDLVGGHHNIMYSNGIDLEVKNKTLLIETFGIDFPKTDFEQFTEDSDSFFDEFLADIRMGKPAILNDRWGSVNSKIQQVIDEILHHPYTESLEKMFLFSKSIELLLVILSTKELLIRHIFLR